MDDYAYNKYPNLPLYSYNCIKHLIEKNEEIWKLLFYNESDAWKKTSLTPIQKKEMIYKGEPDETLFRVFLDEGQINAWINEVSVLRIFPYSIFPENRTVGTVTMAFDIYSHYRINHLSNYQTRVDTMSQIILDVFNGAIIDGIGQLFFNVMGNKENRDYPSGQIPYKGKRITLSTKAVF